MKKLLVIIISFILIMLIGCGDEDNRNIPVEVQNPSHGLIESDQKIDATIQELTRENTGLKRKVATAIGEKETAQQVLFDYLNEADENSFSEVLDTQEALKLIRAASDVIAGYFEIETPASGDKSDKVFFDAEGGVIKELENWYLVHNIRTRKDFREFLNNYFTVDVVNHILRQFISENPYPPHSIYLEYEGTIFCIAGGRGSTIYLKNLWDYAKIDLLDFTKDGHQAVYKLTLPQENIDIDSEEYKHEKISYLEEFIIFKKENEKWRISQYVGTFGM